MKNLSQRARSYARNASSYSRRGKTSYTYPGWARSAHLGGWNPEWLSLELAEARRDLSAMRARDARNGAAGRKVV